MAQVRLFPPFLAFFSSEAYLWCLHAIPLPLFSLKLERGGGAPSLLPLLSSSEPLPDRRRVPYKRGRVRLGQPDIWRAPTQPATVRLCKQGHILFTNSAMPDAKGLSEAGLLLLATLRARLATKISGWLV